ncbi:MAG: MFS transporter [Candidatus Eremiobacteraeota bacterium]|nr:MFS transporter [Candidatus Eremiobacteraeota bacterium]
MRELFEGRRGRVAAGLLVSEFVAATQGLVIAAIMPRVVADLHGLGEYAFQFVAFFAAFLFFLPFAGPWSDRYGLRRVLSVGLALLALGLILVALAPNMATFAGARFVEGVGDGLDYTLSFAAVAKSFPSHLRARMLALNTTMWVLPGIVAPAAGAYVATLWGWRWAFAGLTPLLAFAALLLLPAVDNTPSARHSDPFGALRILFSRATLTLQRGRHALLAAFAVLHAAFFGADAYLALMLVGVRGMSLEAASLCITVAVLGWSGAAMLAPSMQRRYGAAPVVVTGAALCAIGTLALSAVALGAPLWLAFAAWVAAGAGIGTAYPTISADVFANAGEGLEGALSSATALAAVVGLLAGTAVCGIPVTVAAREGFPLAGALVATFLLATAFAAVLAYVGTRVSPTPNRTAP